MSETQSTKIYILPVSGGEFPCQLGLLSEVYYGILKLYNGSFPGGKCYSPDICLGASGGNISAYIGLASDWVPEKIQAICKEIESEMFIRNWWPGPLSVLPSGILGILSGKSLYRPGYGPFGLFNSIFTNSESIQRSEILTLTFNETDRQPQIFSNRGKQNSNFNNEMFDYETIIGYQVDHLIYNNGDISKISETTTASYSIPLITQLKEIDTKKYGDGGISYASPFTPMKLIIGKNYTPTLTHKLQMIYFCSYNVEDKDVDTSSFYGDSNTLSVSLKQMLNASILQDRWSGWQLLAMYGIQLQFERGTDINSDELGQIFSRINDKSYYLILYPKNSPHIDILNFNTNDILRVIEDSSKDYGYYLWYELN
jgi:hypothetical protein